MKASEIREKYLKFFESKGHKRIAPAPLVLENDPSTLFTSSGMQPLVPYLMGQPHPEGKRLVDSQPSIRLQDIEEVGDNRHTTFFEMLGNWSLGDYFKKEQLPWIWEFFTKELGLDPEKLWVSVFEGLPAGRRGNGAVPKDTESFEIWKSLGVPEERIHFYGVKKNWWSRSGTPEQMPVGEIGGPDSEIFYDFGLPHDPKFGPECHPNCDCGRFLEIGNSVFIQYVKKEDGTLEELPQKNVDFGGGLERIAAAVNNEPDVFKIDLYAPIIERVEKITGKNYAGNEVSMRIIADHMRAAETLVGEGVIPSNKLQGYVVRRLVRRSLVKMRSLGATDLKELSDNPEIITEIKRFETTLDKGLKEVAKLEEVSGKAAFDLYQTYGFPLEITEELLREKGKEIDRGQFATEFEKHKEASRSASAGMFKGGLADHSEEVTKLHTATHLLHAALRKVLGEHVSQKGSNITAERLRFDFSHPVKLTDEEIAKVEDLINEQVKKDLPVTMETKAYREAIADGALAFFGERYGEKVNVYTIGDFSKEVCGGPHVANTGKLGHVKITRQEKIGGGVMRIYATLG